MNRIFLAILEDVNQVIILYSRKCDKVSSNQWDDNNANSTLTEQLSNVAKVTKSVTIVTDEIKNKLSDELDDTTTSWIEVDWEEQSNIQEESPPLPVPSTPARPSLTNSIAD